jgi:hypothetical protein
MKGKIPPQVETPGDKINLFMVYYIYDSYIQMTDQITALPYSVSVLIHSILLYILK